MPYTVGQVARLSGVSVRALHHYDQVGLLRPGGRSAAGYREYDEGDLDRLHEVLAYRELGFSLDDIASILDHPADDAEDGPSAHLRRQHGLVRARIARLERVLAHLEMTMEARSMGIALTPEEQFEVFGEDFPAMEYAEEARERWGESEAWTQSQRKAAAYRKEDWLAIKAEAAGIEAGLAAALRDGVPAVDARAMDLAQAHREHISRWFYDVPVEMHRRLAEMYVADPRFAAHYDEVEPGLAQYVHDAILANAERAEA